MGGWRWGGRWVLWGGGGPEGEYAHEYHSFLVLLILKCEICEQISKAYFHLVEERPVS